MAGVHCHHSTLRFKELKHLRHRSSHSRPVQCLQLIFAQATEKDLAMRARAWAADGCTACGMQKREVLFVAC